MLESDTEQRLLGKMRWAGDRDAAVAAEPDSLPVIRTAKDLDRFLLDYFGVRLPAVQVCAEHSTPHSAFHAAYFAASPIAVWKASRGFGGKSFTLSLLGLTEALTLRADVNVLGGSGEQSQRILESMAKLWAWPAAPRQFLRTDPGSRKTVLTFGNTIKALMASQTSVRGPHPQRLRLDEADEMNLAILDSAMGQPMSRGDVLSQTVISSTHQYPDGTMAEVLKRAAAKNWPVFEWSVAQGTRVLCRRGWQPIETLQPHKDQAWTRSGWRQIQQVTRMGRKPVLTLTFDDGGQLQVTPDHRIATSTGWQRAERLFPGDAVTAGSSPGPKTQATVPAMISGGNISIFGAIWVPLRAVGACDLCGDMRGANHIHLVGDGFQVVRSNACPTAAGMVRFQSFRNWPDPDAICQPMDQLFPRPTVHDAIAVPVGGQRPDPAVAFHANPCKQIGSIVGYGAGATVDTVGASLTTDSGPCQDSGPTITLRHIVSITHGAIAVPVWDLGIEGDHEFLAEGVIVHNCYHETKEPHGWLPLSEVARLRGMITDLMWRTEYELQEPTGENRAIDQDAVRAMFTGGDLNGDPDPDANYVHGADWARKTNRTVILTFRKPTEPDADADPADDPNAGTDTRRGPLTLAAITTAAREPWPTMVGYLEAHVRKYGGPAIHDGTGVGDVVAGYLNVEANAFIMVGKARADLLTEYVHAVEHGEILIPDDGSQAIRIFKKEHTFATFDDLYGAGHLPDTIAAAALAYRAARMAQGGSGQMKDPPAQTGGRSALQGGFRRGGGIFNRG